MSLTGSTLPEAVEQSLEEQVDRLEGLKTEIMLSARADQALSESEAVGNTYRIVSRLTAGYTKTDDSRPLPADLVTLVVDRFEPTLVEVVNELEQLWRDVRRAVHAGADGSQPFDSYVEHCDTDETSAAMRLVVVQQEIQDILMELAFAEGFENLF